MFTWGLVCLHSDQHIYMKNIISTWRGNNDAYGGRCVFNTNYSYCTTWL